MTSSWFCSVKMLSFIRVSQICRHAHADVGYGMVFPALDINGSTSLARVQPTMSSAG